MGKGVTETLARIAQQGISGVVLARAPVEILRLPDWDLPVIPAVKTLASNPS